MTPPVGQDGAGHAKYHLKVEKYTPLDSEQSMRSYSTALATSRPQTAAPSASTSKPTLAGISTNLAISPSISTSSKDPSARKSVPPTPSNPTRGRFVQLKPSFEPTTAPDFAYGIIHLYRDITSTEDKEITSVGRKPGTTEEENVLAILAVPSYMTANDFMGFVGERQRTEVSHFRMIRTEAANRYMVLLKFRTSDAAREFHADFNAKAFNSMEVLSHLSLARESGVDSSLRHVMLCLSRA
jgi:hypothetical protein